MKKDFKAIRKAAYKHLYLIYVKSAGEGMYHLDNSEADGALPVLCDYIGIQFNSTKIKVKDVGSNIIYLVDPKRFRNSRLEAALAFNPGLEEKLELWFPFLWGKGSRDDYKEKYFSIIRQLEGYAEMIKPMENFNLDDYRLKTSKDKKQRGKN